MSIKLSEEYPQCTSVREAEVKAPMLDSGGVQPAWSCSTRRRSQPSLINMMRWRLSFVFVERQHFGTVLAGGASLVVAAESLGADFLEFISQQHLVARAEGGETPPPQRSVKL